MFFEDIDEEILVSILDELCYRIKVCDSRTEMVKEFEIVLKQFLEDWELDQDQHMFAVLPKKNKE